MADEAISAASTTMPMRSMHYFCEFSSNCVLSGPEPNGVFYDRCMRAEENDPSLFSSYYLFPGCVDEEIKEVVGTVLTRKEATQ